jgi:hypothetical protein
VKSFSINIAGKRAIMEGWEGRFRLAASSTRYMEELEQVKDIDTKDGR